MRIKMFIRRVKQVEDLIDFSRYSSYSDSGEGGLAVFFVLLTSDKNRQKCIAGEGMWPAHDVVTGPPKYKQLEHELIGVGRSADLIMLVGSTKNSLWSDALGYFFAEEEDLTEKGRKLYDMLAEIYGEKPDIVTLLDT